MKRKEIPPGPKKKSARKKKSTAIPAPSPDQVNRFPIVAIGASAGGLEAMTQLLQHLPADTGMAFIFVQHLSPDHESILVSLLTKNSAMPVQEATQMVTIEPNTLYVMPSDKAMQVLDGHITLSPRPKSKQVNLLIDVFFTSLAEKHKENVIGIILSGSATDGTQGMKAIKYEGGLTFAQDDSAKFTSMPKSAIAAGVVDFVLSPEQIAQELIRFSKHPLMQAKGKEYPVETDLEQGGAELKYILDLLHKTYGVNFHWYKSSTIKRRILRRMLLAKVKSLPAYIRTLKEKQDEVNLLFNDLLIHVTSFFREAEVSKYLKATLFPRLLQSKKRGQALRIWVTACSTGEEAYSLGMLLIEIQDTLGSHIPIQIFATDLSHHAISKARIGWYSKQEMEQVSPRRLQRFFTRSDGGYRIAQTVRDMCVFAPHNILSDPPFSRIDFISCCNLLIYFDAAAQQKVMTTFHYALNPEGFLLLGPSESIGLSASLFSVFHQKFKVFARKKNSGSGSVPTPDRKLSRLISSPDIMPDFSPAGSKNFSASNGLDQAVNALLLSRYMPACVVINQQMEILQFRGFTSPYLEHPQGRASLNVLTMARPEIAFELRNAIFEAVKTLKDVQKKDIELKGLQELITLDVVQVTDDSQEPVWLVMFSPQQIAEQTAAVDSSNMNNTHYERKLIKLEEEIAAYREQLRSISHHHEAAIEELQSANEEVVSSNEELRSINEELETSKEEIQSSNEELATTNQELQTRNDLLNESYHYSESIISTIHDAMIILDKHLRVKTASASFYKQFQTTEEETEGKHIYDLGSRQWNIPELRKLLEDIIPANTSFADFEIEQTFPKIGAVILLLNARKIIQPAHQEQLILLAISNVTEMVRRQRSEKQELEQQINEQTKLASVTHTEIQKQKLQTLEFEQAVQQRTKELNEANKELAEKNSALKKVNKELESFAYVSSHDLQEPLRKIQTFVHLIAKNEHARMTEKGKDYFHRVIKAAERMQVLIDDLLAFSRINIGDINIEMTPLAPIIEAVKNEMKEIIEDKKAVIEVNILCDARIIPFQFHQLMQNLLSNSLKFSEPSRAPHIVIESHSIHGSSLQNAELKSDQDYCHITVTDNGIGFEQIFEQQVFEVFQRLHNQEKYPGTGIGLAIAKKIVENHQGIIKATSELQVGTRFDIYLPH